MNRLGLRRMYLWQPTDTVKAVEQLAAKDLSLPSAFSCAHYLVSTFYLEVRMNN